MSEENQKEGAGGWGGQGTRIVRIYLRFKVGGVRSLSRESRGSYLRHTLKGTQAALLYFPSLAYHQLRLPAETTVDSS